MKPYLTLHHPAHAKRYYEEQLWRDDTFYDLLSHHATERPRDTAVQDASRSLTWRELKLWADGVAADLREYGLGGGDRVLMWMSNRVEAIVMFLACAREGIACNPSVHKTHTCGEVATLLGNLGAKAFLVEDGWGADRETVDLDAILVRIPSLKVVYTPTNFPRPAGNNTAPKTDPDAVVYLAFTSGTTGAPKCVMHSHNTLLANARDLVRDWQHGRDMVLLSLSPLSHHIAWVGVAQWLLVGGKFVTGDPPKDVSRLDWLEKTGATYVLGVPTHAMDVLAEQRQSNRSTLGGVKTFYMAGAPIPPSVAASFVDQGVRPQNVYGMTENSSHQYTHPNDDAETILASCGRGGRSYRIKLFDPSDADKEVGVGEVGQIAGRGAALMLGYFGNQSATDSSFNSDGWFLSGDLGILDAAGNLRIEGRLKDLIIRGGHNIYPSHIEAIALRHAEAGRVAVFPVADERLGERVCIAVSGRVSSDEMLEHLKTEGLSKYDMPEYFVTVADFPLTASGKILKRELVLQVRRGELTPTFVNARRQARSA
ncbi:cyclohexanecarboxylate-CoA ligase [Rhodopseudomonas boonkerdii]|uniref:class I adenylate-forming enzyme family protein n=1 Tax=Rhodopseudomonas boonkerdii TaxID=475937 RepID=UPI001E59EFDC|nr:class I adenylate-forming enzyme family protein [Rhodopseudomonas boonkerdii]UGV28631.1 cyclohexanecarboxylate-CoA ligase [Rhodopseudomonas boonkerdii]